MCNAHKTVPDIVSTLHECLLMFLSLLFVLFLDSRINFFNTQHKFIFNCHSFYLVPAGHQYQTKGKELLQGEKWAQEFVLWVNALYL